MDDLKSYFIMLLIIAIPAAAGILLYEYTDEAAHKCYTIHHHSGNSYAFNECIAKERAAAKKKAKKE